MACIFIFNGNNYSESDFRELMLSEYKKEFYERDRNGEPLIKTISEKGIDGNETVRYFFQKTKDTSIDIGTWNPERGFETNKEFDQMISQQSDLQAKDDFNHKLAKERENNQSVKRQRLTDIFKNNGVKVSFEEDKYLDVNAKIDKVEGRNITIKYNPERTQDDTDVHEFAHIYTDLLGDSNPLLKNATNQIRGTEYWNRIKKNNPGKEDSWIDREAVVTAIGLEGNGILQGKELSKFKSLVNRIWYAIADVLGIKYDYVRRIAMEMTTGKLQKDLKGDIQSGWEQKKSFMEEDLGNQKYQESIKVDDEKNKYYTPEGEMDRVTEFSREKFSNMPTIEEIAERDAKHKMAINITTEGDGMAKKTYEDYYQEELKKRKKPSAEGRYYHAFVEFMLAKTKEKRDIVLDKMKGILQGQDNEPINTKRLSFLFNKNDQGNTKMFNHIFTKLGLRIFEKEDNVHQLDKYESEAKFYNKEFGLGRTIDLAAEKPNGDLYWVDFKFGERYHSDTFFDTLKHSLGNGIDKDMIDNAEGRAELEMTLSMLMYKDLHPEARWTDLVIAHINAKNIVSPYSVDVKNNLKILENYYKLNDPKLYERLKKKNLFDSREYGGLKDTIFNLDEAKMNMDPETLRKNVELEIQSLQNKIKEKHVTMDSWYDKEGRIRYRDKLKELLDQYSALKSHVSMRDPIEKDQGLFRTWLGTIYDVKSNYLQIFRNLLYERKTAKDSMFSKIVSEHDALFQKVLDERGNKNILRKLGIVSTNITELNKPYLIDRTGDNPGIHLVTRKDQTYPLSKNDQAYLEHVRKTMADKYKQVMMMPVISPEHGKVVFLYEKLGLEKELPEDFFPVIEAGSDEIRERMGTFTKDNAEDVFRRMMLVFLDKEGRTSGGNHSINLRGIGRAAEENRISRNHTYSVEKAYKEFMKNLVEMEHMQSVIDIGDAIKIYYNSQYQDGKPLYPNNSKWIESIIEQVILHQQKEMTWGGKELAIKWKLPFGFKKDEVLYIKPDKFIMALKNFTSFTFMGLNLPAASFNTVLNIGLGHMEALKGTLAQLMGIPKEDIDVTLENQLKADAEVIKLMWYGITGKERQGSKLYNIARKFDFLTNNYDIRVRKEDYLAPKNKFWDTSLFYLFYKLSEDFSTYGILASQLMSMKNRANGKSMWDSYDVNGEWIGGTRGKVLDYESADGKKYYKDLKELDYKEIMHLKRVSNRIWGNYRAEERVMLEQYAIGRLLLQFKKWMPAVMMSVYQGRFEDSALGAYKLTGEQELDGQKVDIYDFQNRLHEGRMRVLTKALWFNTLGMMNSSRNKEGYTWNTMTNENKQHIINFGMTMLTMIGFAMASGAFTDDKEKDSYFKQRMRRLFYQDFAQGWNPVDLLKNISSGDQFGLGRLVQLINGFSKLMFLGMIKGDRLPDGRMPGINELWRLTPFAQVAYSWGRYMGTDMEDTPFGKLLGTVGLDNTAILPKTK